MSKSKIFIWIVITFAVGILAASAFDIPRQGVYLFLALSAVCFCVAFVSEKKITALVTLFLVCAGTGAFRLQISIHPGQFQNLLDVRQQMEGYIVEDVEIKNNLQQLTFRPNNFKQDILISETLGQKFFYGDRVVATGKIEEAKNYGNFDYQKYLRRYNIYGLMDYPQVLILKTRQLNPLKYWLLMAKAAFSRKISVMFSQPQQSFLLAILTGEKGNLPQSVIGNFSKTGASHIIAADGYKVAVLVGLLSSLAPFFGRRAAFWLTILALTGFVVITGAPASVVRSAIMGFLLVFSINIGRQYSIVPALFFAAALMLLFNPKILFWDAGFQLSFAATLGIVYFMPVLKRLSRDLPDLWFVKNLFLITLAAVVSTMPFILLDFGVLSLSAPVVNVLIMPALSFAMAFGFLSVLPFLGKGFAFIANGLLSYILKVTAFFALLPYASLSFSIAPWMFWLLLAAVFGLYFLLRFFAGRMTAKNTDS